MFATVSKITVITNYKIWAPWKADQNAAFRYSKTKANFIHALQAERERLVQAKNAYRAAIDEAKTREIPATALELIDADELSSNSSMELLEETSGNLKRTKVDRVDDWRRQAINETPPALPLDPAEEQLILTRVEAKLLRRKNLPANSLHTISMLSRTAELHKTKRLYCLT
jgi:hypothetical protein